VVMSASPDENRILSTMRTERRSAILVIVRSSRSRWALAAD
jgi:hypothetical protein